MEWRQVAYSKNRTRVPSERWGHRLVRTKSNQIVLYGGFGGSSSDGRYLSDVWCFSTATHSWKFVETTGELPESRSNYSIHYDTTNDSIILFGGGSNNKMRYNDVYMLDWKTKVWTKYIPQESSAAPWERTYHASQFSYPYLIVHGGEGVSNLDLDDMWVFNVISKKWNKLEFDHSPAFPRKRRFHSAALINGYFYIIGGCTGNYQLLGDIHCVNLNKLFENNQYDHYTWQCKIIKHKSLERWGHSSDAYQGKIYISCGRVSAQFDNNDTFSFDPVTLLMTKLQTQSDPIPRRRHATVLMGNSLLLFGGYNGKYLNDFHYLALNEQMQKSIRGNYSILVDNHSELIEKLNQHEEKSVNDIKIELKNDNNTIYTLNTIKHRLAVNKFMTHMLQQTNGDLSIELPKFCDVTIFRIINLFITEGELLLSSDFSLQFYLNLILSCQYFLCNESDQLIENQLLKVVKKDNCMQMIQLSNYFDFKSLKVAAAEIYFLEQNNSMHTIDFESNHATIQHISPSPEQPKQIHIKAVDVASKAKINSLSQIYEVIRFDIEQKKLKAESQNILSRAAKSIKSIFVKPSKQSVIGKVEKSEKQQGCFGKFLDLITGICMNSKVEQQQTQNSR